MLKSFEAVERPEPTTRWDDIMRIMTIVEDNIKKIYRDLTGRRLEFRYIKYAIDSKHVGIKPNFYTESDIEKPFRDYTIKLRYRDIKDKRDVPSHHLIMYLVKEVCPMLVSKS